MNKNNLIFGSIVVVVLVVIAGGTWYAVNYQSPEEANNNVSINVDPSVPTPALDAELEFPDGYSAEAREALERNTATIKGVLEENPSDYGAWIDLAIQYKTVENYDKAEEIWLYLTEAAPGRNVAYHNLGNLYHLYLEDYPEAARYYREAIERAPGQAIHYIGLHELYRYSYEQDSDNAAQVLTDGLEEIPDSVDLMATLAGYYKAEGKTQQAIEWYKNARDAAQESNDTAVVVQFNTEIRALEEQAAQ